MADIEGIRRRAAAEVGRHCRFNGIVCLLGGLARVEPLSADDHRLYFMAWRVTRVLYAQPGDLVAERSSTVPTS